MRLWSRTSPRGRGKAAARWAAAGADVDGRLSYLRDSAGTFGWLAARAAAQAVTVLLLARQLGPEAYGQLVAALAIGGFLVPVANLGLPGALVRDLSRRDTRGGNTSTPEAVGIWICVGPAAAAVAATLAVLVLPGMLAPWAVAALAMGETLSASGGELLARIFQGRRRLMRFGQAMFSLPGARAVALGLCAVLDVRAPEAWVSAYAAAGVLPAVWLVLAEPAAPGRAWRTWRKLARRGRPFALSALAVRLQGELNKPLLAQLSHASAGQFGLAQRIVDIVLLPFVALMESLLPRVYARAHDPLQLLRETGAPLVILALAAGVGISVGGEWILGLFGSGYSDTSWMLIALCAFPAARVATTLGNVALVALGLATYLPRVVWGGGIGGTLAALALIPWFGALGAVAALYVGELIALAVQLMVLHSSAKGNQKTSAIKRRSG